MNHELPKPLREALARQVAGDVHPSADALTAFAEHSLPQGESQRVTAHLAQCADCREVVFLASSAVEEPAAEKEKLVAAASPTTSAGFAKAEAQQALYGAASGAVAGRSRWRLWWVWAPAVAAVLVVAGVVIQQRSEFSRSAPMTMAVKAPPPVATTSERAPGGAPAPEVEPPRTLGYTVTAERQKAPAKTARAESDQRRSPESRTGETITLSANEVYPSAPKVAAAPQPSSPPPLGALAGAVKSAPAAAPAYHSFAESEGQTTTALLARPRPNMEKPQMTMRSVSGPHSQWRISSDGHLERSTSPGSWTPVLGDQSTTFHVVSVVGNNVWAGGSGGALFHSSDAGQDWSEQPLAAEAGTIVSIQFSDAMHGIVTTDGGSQWTTSDGGVTWTKK